MLAIRLATPWLIPDLFVLAARLDQEPRVPTAVFSRRAMTMMTVLQTTLMAVVFLLLTNTDSSSIAMTARAQQPTGEIDTKLDETAVATESTPLPDWVENEPYTVDNVTFLVAKTDQSFRSAQLADEALDPVIRETIQRYLESKLGHHVPVLQITAADLHTKLIVPGSRQFHSVDEPYTEELAKRYGTDHETSYRAIAKIKLDTAFLGEIRDQIQRQTVLFRLRMTGLFGSGTLALLVVLFGYLRIEHATRGLYNRRLQTIGILLAAAIVGAIWWGVQFLR